MLDEPIIQKSLSEEVYNRLRLSIFQNVYVSGQQLDIVEIAQKFRVSRQPVKEAINRLAQEGLVEIRNRVGSYIRTYTAKDVKQIMEARLMIETFALAEGRVDQDTIRALELKVEQMDAILSSDSFNYLSYLAADVEFHLLLVNCSHNEVITKMYKDLNAHHIVARAFYSNAFERTITRYGQHRRIIDYLTKSQTDKALDELRKHILHALEGLVKLYS